MRDLSGNVMSIGAIVVNYKQTNEWSDKIGQININMTPEDNLNSQIWELLQDINEEYLITVTGNPVKFRVPNIVGGGIIPRDRKIKILNKLEELGGLKIHRNERGVRIGSDDTYYLWITPDKFSDLYAKYEGLATKKVDAITAVSSSSLPVVIADFESLYERIDPKNTDKEFYINVANYGKFILDNEKFKPLLKPLYDHAKNDIERYSKTLKDFHTIWQDLAKDILEQAKKANIKDDPTKWYSNAIATLTSKLRSKPSLEDNSAGQYYLPYWELAKQFKDNGVVHFIEKKHLKQSGHDEFLTLDRYKTIVDLEWEKFKTLRESSVWWSHYQLMRLAHGVFEVKEQDPYYDSDSIVDTLYRYEFDQIAKGNTDSLVILKRKKFEDCIKKVHSYLLPRLKSLLGPSEKTDDLKSDTKRKKISKPYSTPAGTKWEEITIKFLDGHNVQISCRGSKTTVNYKEMGMQDDRSLRPNKQWVLLELLAVKNGELTWQDKEASLKVVKQKQILTDTLQEFFQLDEDPFYEYNGRHQAYKIKIVLIPLAADPSAPKRVTSGAFAGVEEVFSEFTEDTT